MKYLAEAEVLLRLEQSMLQVLLREAPSRWPGLEELIRVEAASAAAEALRHLCDGVHELRWRGEGMPQLVGEERRIGSEEAGQSVFVRIHAGAGLSMELRHELERRAPARAILVCRPDAYAPLCFFEPQIRLVPVLPSPERLLRQIQASKAS